MDDSMSLLMDSSHIENSNIFFHVISFYYNNAKVQAIDNPLLILDLLDHE